MESKQPLSEIMGMTMEKIRELVDVNTIIGEPIKTDDGTTVIPVSKVMFGFGSGGSSFGKGKSTQQDTENFGGGSGAGVTIIPIGFLSIAGGTVNFIGVTSAEQGDSIGKLIDMLPEIMGKVKELLSKKKKEKKEIQLDDQENIDNQEK